MDAWRYIVRSDHRRRTIESYLPLLLSAAGALGILPFAVIRIMHHEWLAAGIDLVSMYPRLGTMASAHFSSKKMHAAAYC